MDKNFNILIDEYKSLKTIYNYSNETNPNEFHKKLFCFESDEYMFCIKRKIFKKEKIFVLDSSKLGMKNNVHIFKTLKSAIQYFKECMGEKMFVDPKKIYGPYLCKIIHDFEDCVIYKYNDQIFFDVDYFLRKLYTYLNDAPECIDGYYNGIDINCPTIYTFDTETEPSYYHLQKHRHAYIFVRLITPENVLKIMDNKFFKKIENIIF